MTTTKSDHPSALRLAYTGNSSEDYVASDIKLFAVGGAKISRFEKVERLRRAILNSIVPELGQNVNETLCELCEKLDECEDEHFARCARLLSSLELRGLKFCLAAPQLNLDSEGYLTLVNSKSLLVQHPELSEFFPGDYNFMTFGELPLLRSVPPVARSGIKFLNPVCLELERPRANISGCSFFDALGCSRPAQQSNTLRHSILSLQLNVGGSVKAAVSELSGLFEVGEQINRIDDLLGALECLGLKFKQVKKDYGLPIKGYVWLAKPELLLGEHPELAVLHPVEWPGLRMA